MCLVNKKEKNSKNSYFCFTSVLVKDRKVKKQNKSMQHCKVIASVRKRSHINRLEAWKWREAEIKY